jgi:methylenetetrahydrofolate dehydrogenase (NAD+)
VDKQDLEEKITEANEDRAVNGIMVYYPVFGGKQVRIYI